MRNSAHGSPPAWSITMRHASRRIRGGDEMLGSLGGRSRHHSGVFERATQAHGGVVRAVRAQHGGRDPESGRPEAGDIPMSPVAGLETAAPAPGLQDRKKSKPSTSRTIWHKPPRYKNRTKNRPFHIRFSPDLCPAKVSTTPTLDSLADIRFEIMRSM